MRRRPASFRAWSTSIDDDPYPDPGPLPPSSGYRTIKTTDWLQSLILNILNTRARTDLKCPSPAAVYGHWSESYRDDDLYIGSRLWNAAEKSYARISDAVKAIQAAVEYDMAKLTMHGRRRQRRRRGHRYRGSNTVGVDVTATVVHAKHVINLSGSFVSGYVGVALDRWLASFCVPIRRFCSIRSRRMFASTVLGGGKVIPRVNEWYVVANDYAMAEQFYAIADQMWRENNPETACCDNLYKMAAQHGVFPAPAASRRRATRS